MRSLFSCLVAVYLLCVLCSCAAHHHAVISSDYQDAYLAGATAALLCALEYGYATPDSSWGCDTPLEDFSFRFSDDSLSSEYVDGGWEFVRWSVSHRESISDACCWFGIDAEEVCDFLGIDLVPQ